MRGRAPSKKELECRLNLYKQGLSDHKIAKKIGISHQSIQAWRNRNNLQANKKQGGQVIELDFKPSWELGYIIGLTVGDGSLCKHQRGYTLDFRSTRKDFIDLIESMLIKTFPQLAATRCTFFADTETPSRNKYHVRYYSVSCSSTNLYYFLKKYKKDNGIWYIPNDQPNIVKYGFIGGIIDAEGNIAKSCVRIFSKHKENLIRLKSLLQEFRFIYGKLSILKESVYVLTINGRRNHKLLLNKTKLPYKQAQLRKYVAQKTYHYTAEEYWNVMELRKNGFGKTKISKKTGLPIETISNWIYKGIMPSSLRLAKKYGDSFQDG